MIDLRGGLALLGSSLLLLNSFGLSWAEPDMKARIHDPAHGSKLRTLDAQDESRRPERPAPLVAQSQAGSERGSSGAAPVRPGRPLELTIERSLEIALKSNLDVQIATLGTQAAELEIPRAQARFHPLVGFSATAAKEKATFDSSVDSRTNSQTVRPFIRQELPTGLGTSVLLSAGVGRSEDRLASQDPITYDSDVSISLIQPLLRGVGPTVATADIQNARYDSRIEQARLRSLVLRTTARTKTAYYRVLLAERVIERIEAAIERDRKLVESSRDLFTAGIVTRRDIFGAELILAQDSARLVNAQADLEVLQNQFVDVLGLPIGTPVVLVDKSIDFEPIPLRLDEWIGVAIKNRPEIEAIKEQLEKSALNVRVARNGLLPQLDLVASYTRASGAFVFGNSLALDGYAWSVGVLFSIPVGNVAARVALSKAEIQHTQLEKQFSQTQRQIELEVRAAEIALRRSVERTKTLEIAVDQAQGRLQVANARFALGEATNLDITDAQTALLSAETDLLNAIVDYNVGLAELEARIAHRP